MQVCEVIWETDFVYQGSKIFITKDMKEHMIRLAESFFKKKVRELVTHMEVSDEELYEALDDGYYENEDITVLFNWPDVVEV